jgi:N-acyl-D-amino-acid deacylase
MSQPMRTLITNARIVDGTGAPAREGDVLLEDETIAAVGLASARADTVVDARGMVVAPGFIDMHSHSDFSLPDDPLAPAKVLQGVTTEVVGNCGMGVFPSNERVDELYARFGKLIFGEQARKGFATLDQFRTHLRDVGPSVNAACLVPHGNVRTHVMALAERAPSAAELRAMEGLVEDAMNDGAFGLSTGLVYAPGAFAKTDELISLAKVTATRGGIYASHIRDEGARLVESVAEAIEVGRRSGASVQISHHKAAGITAWGKVKTTLAMVDRARAEGIDVHSDVYPYTAGSTVLAAILVSPWVWDGTAEEALARLRDPVVRERLRREHTERLLAVAKLPPALRFVPRRWVARLVFALGERWLVLSSLRRRAEYEGLTVGQVARRRKQPTFDAMLDLLVEEELGVVAIAHMMRERDVQTVMRHPQTMIGTDGFPTREGKPHPRLYGTYPRMLERYVRERHVLTLEDAVRRMTALPARKLGLVRRGTLATGHAADVVVFDADRVHDRATFRDPRRAPTGICHVFVNGVWTVRDGKHTGARAGRVLRRQEEREATRAAAASPLTDWDAESGQAS